MRYNLKRLILRDCGSEVDVLFDGLLFFGLVSLFGHEFVGVTDLGRCLHVGNVDHIGNKVGVDVVLGNCLAAEHKHKLNRESLELAE